MTTRSPWIRVTKRVWGATLVGVMVAALSACGGIPTSGGVNAGEPFVDEPTGDFVFNPLDPVKDGDQRTILDGFIAAFTGPQGDYAVARLFLSKDFKKEWDPRQSVLIRTGSPSLSSSGPTSMDYSFTSVAQLDEFGAYSTVGSAVQTLQFHFVKEDGQWRIDQAPPGIVLPMSTFLTIFSKHALYFYDVSLNYLVPDERWFLGGTTATRIVTALLAGPPEWLKGAVVSQFPDGTQLNPGTTVTVDATVAQVDLTAEAAGADGPQRQRMQLQLTESLASVPGIASVEISVADSILAIEPMGTDGPIVQRAVDSRPLVMADGAFGYLSGSDLTLIPQLSDRVAALEPRAVAVGVNATDAAVLTADGVYAVRAGQKQAQLVDDRAGLIAPAIDDFGFVWSVPAESPNSLIVVGPDGTTRLVTVALPTGSRIVSLNIAQDNVRVAIMVQTIAGARLIVAAISRDAAQDYVPLGIGAPVLDSLIDGDDAVDAAWIDRFSVATLTRADDASFVSAFEVGGQRSSLGKPMDGVAIVGGNGRTGLRVLDAEHHVQSPRGSSWQATTATVDLIASQR